MARRLTPSEEREAIARVKAWEAERRTPGADDQGRALDETGLRHQIAAMIRVAQFPAISEADLLAGYRR